MGFLEYLAGEETDKFEKAALVLRTLGWISIVWGCVTMLWIWMGLKAGSDLWLIWTISQFVLGAVLLGIANHLQSRAARLVLAPQVVVREPETRDRAA
jgi:hypothetical protein